MLSSLWGPLSLQTSTVDLFREQGPAPFKAESDLLAADLHMLIVVAPELLPQALLPHPHDRGAPGNSEMFGWNFHKTTHYLLRCCSQSLPKCYHSGLGFPLLPVPSSLGGARGGGHRRRAVWAVPGTGRTDSVRCGQAVGQAAGTIASGHLGKAVRCSGESRAPGPRADVCRVRTPSALSQACVQGP